MVILIEAADNAERKNYCKPQMGLVRENGEREEKWVKYYSSFHQILLVGDGDFSFSLSLALRFGSASNIVASSLDSYDAVIKKYEDAKSNLEMLGKLGAYCLHGVDATKMKLHTDLQMRKFDRIIYNFPHAGFHGREENPRLINMHRNLVHGFFRSASAMLRANGEIHVNHKTTAPFSHWNIQDLADQNSLALIESVDFKIKDYPGYNNKRGAGGRCDEPFPLGQCRTFKFRFSPTAKKVCQSRRNRNRGSAYSKPHQLKMVHPPVPQLPPVNFKNKDYPGYNDKRGAGGRCNEPFSLGRCSTFKFRFSPTTNRSCQSRRQRNRCSAYSKLHQLQMIQSPVPQLPTVDYKIKDYPGYNDKRGAGGRCDEPFPLGQCSNFSNFKFTFSPTAKKSCHSRRKRNCGSAYSKPHQLKMIQPPVSQLRPVDLKNNDYPGYNDKRGADGRCNERFPLGQCSTFSPTARKSSQSRRKRNRVSAYGKPSKLQMIQPPVPQPPPVDFKISDYPGHNAGGRCDEPFPLGQCSTFQFRLSPTAKKLCQSRRKRNRGSTYSKPHQRQMTRPVPQQPNSLAQHYENPFMYLNCGPRRREHCRTFEEVRSCNRNFWEY